MLKKALVILAEGFEEIEAVTAVDILRRADINVTAAGLSEIKVQGSRGIVVVADARLDEVECDFDVCVLPGGTVGAMRLASSQKATSLIKEMFQMGKIIAAICASPALVLAPLGILDNKSATCYAGMQEDFNETTVYKDEAVVVDGNIITSQGVATALLFALSIVEKIAGLDVREQISRAILMM
jgi:4-methyl-5(b-hydroxyethyl)-thiazole monophosphate biosynthesis